MSWLALSWFHVWDFPVYIVLLSLAVYTLTSINETKHLVDLRHYFLLKLWLWCTQSVGEWWWRDVFCPRSGTAQMSTLHGHWTNHAYHASLTTVWQLFEYHIRLQCKFISKENVIYVHMFNIYSLLHYNNVSLRKQIYDVICHWAVWAEKLSVIDTNTDVLLQVDNTTCWIYVNKQCTSIHEKLKYVYTKQKSFLHVL